MQDSGGASDVIRGGPATFTSEMALVLPAECWGRFVWGAPMGRRMKPLDIGVVIGWARFGAAWHFAAGDLPGSGPGPNRQ
jgi:hypothetical protein